MSKIGAVARGVGYLLSLFTTAASFIVRQIVVSPATWFMIRHLALLSTFGFIAYAVGDYVKLVLKKHTTVLEIICWRDPKRSGIALTATLTGIFLVAKLPLIPLILYTSLVILTGTVIFRVFNLANALVKRTSPSNTFDSYLERDVVMPLVLIHAQIDVIVAHTINAIVHLRRLFLVASISDSIKFGFVLWSLPYICARFPAFAPLIIYALEGLFFSDRPSDSVKFALQLWTLTYIGDWFSGLTLVIIFALCVFSVPKLYAMYKEPIDRYLALI